LHWLLVQLAHTFSISPVSRIISALLTTLLLLPSQLKRPMHWLLVMCTTLWSVNSMWPLILQAVVLLTRLVFKYNCSLLRSSRLATGMPVTIGRLRLPHFSKVDRWKRACPLLAESYEV